MGAQLKNGGMTSVEHGRWGEDIAAQYLANRGYEIVARNVRPVAADRRLEIDLIVYDRRANVVVFVEVKQHKRRREASPRMASVDRHKRDLLRRACRAWLYRNHWRDSYRFDVVEIWGEPESGLPEIDHIERVRLFVPSERFVDWASCDVS